MFVKVYGYVLFRVWWALHNGCIYRSSNSVRRIITAYSINNEVCANLAENEKIVIMGDFNLPDIDWLLIKSNGANSFAASFVDIVQDNYLNQLVTGPTRARNRQIANLLDLLLVTDDELIDNIKYCSPLGNSDHIVLRLITKQWLGLRWQQWKNYYMIGETMIRWDRSYRAETGQLN